MALNWGPKRAAPGPVIAPVHWANADEPERNKESTAPPNTAALLFRFANDVLKIVIPIPQRKESAANPQLEETTSTLRASKAEQERQRGRAL